MKETFVGNKIDDPTPGTSHDSSLSESDIHQPINASRTKLILPDSLSEISDEESDFQGQGYRLIDLNKFSSTLFSAHVCEKGEIIF